MKLWTHKEDGQTAQIETRQASSRWWVRAGAAELPPPRKRANRVVKSPLLALLLGQCGALYWPTRIKLKWNTQFCCCWWWISNTLSASCTYSVFKKNKNVFCQSGRESVSHHLSGPRPAESELVSTTPAWMKKSIWQTLSLRARLKSIVSCCCFSVI